MKLVFAQTMKLAMASMALTSLGSFAYGKVTAPGTYRIEIRVTDAEREKLATGTKTDVPEASLEVFEGTTRVGEFTVDINTRGVTSLSTYPRKNFNVESIISKEAKEQNPEAEAKKIEIGDIKGKELVLSASPEDVLGTKNMIAYGLLGEVGVRALKPQYAEVILNGVSQGLYFVTKTSGDEILKTDVKDANGNKIPNDYDVVIRRRYGDTFDADLNPQTGKIKLKGVRKGLSQEKIKDYVATLSRLHAAADSRVLSGAGRLAMLSKNLDLKNYMKWMAMNYILRNGDYSDEVFFFGKTTAGGDIMFDVMPWDQDDSFGTEMHQAGIVASINHGLEEKGIADKTLVYNFESNIDLAIATDPEMLRAYFKVVEKMITQLKAKDSVNKVVAKLTGKLAPYMADKDVMESGVLDKSKAVYVKESILAGFEERKAFINDRMAKAEAQIKASASILDNDLAAKLGTLHVKIGKKFLTTMASIEKHKAQKARAKIKEEAAKQSEAEKAKAANDAQIAQGAEDAMALAKPEAIQP